MNDFVDDDSVDLRETLETVRRRVNYWISQYRTRNQWERENHQPAPHVMEAVRLGELLGKRKLTLDDLTVMSPARDPYRLGDAGHALGQWFADQLGDKTGIHLRGIHYRLVSAANVLRLDGKRYVNTDECWRYLCNASLAARWLRYIGFDDIIDERNDKPFERMVITGAISEPSVRLRPGEDIDDHTLLPRPERLLPDIAAMLRDLEYAIPDVRDIIPEVDAILPSWKVDYQASDDQPFRIIMMGEKTSLKEVLSPLAERVNAELILDTGDPSLTHIAGVAERASRDYRPAVVLFFSDFDPTRYAMPRTVSRRFQALKEAFFPSLNIRVHQVALTLKQVVDLDLPSAPIKESELRKAKWIERTEGANRDRCTCRAPARCVAPDRRRGSRAIFRPALADADQPCSAGVDRPRDSRAERGPGLYRCQGGG